MELLSCLAFNWKTAWDPDQWGVDMSFLPSTSEGNDNSSSSVGSGKRTAEGNDIEMNSDSRSRAETDAGKRMESEADSGEDNEELWAHRIFYIVAKIANFRAGIPLYHDSSPHDEQILLPARYTEWKRLKSMCDAWNAAVPRPMHPFGYIPPLQTGGRSLFPNVW